MYRMYQIVPSISLVKVALRILAAERGNVIDVSNANVTLLLNDVREHLKVYPFYTVSQVVRALIYDTYDGLERYNIGFDDDLADEELALFAKKYG